MQEASFTSAEPVVVHFRGWGRAGTVRSYYGVTKTASGNGFPALRGWSDVRKAGAGFPTIKCEVESDRPGYWSNLGWVQWVTQDFPDRRNAVRLVDRLPAFLDQDVPFATMGYAPSFFDAPAYLSLPAIDWRATLFLCTLPMMSRREPVAPLAGFTWGYRIASRGKPPVPYPIGLAGPGDWFRVRAELLRRHPRWKFEPRYRSVSRVPN